MAQRTRRLKNPPLRQSRPIDPQFTRFRLCVARSRIHHLGVFALEAIPRGREVIEYAGERVSRREARRRYLRGWGRKDLQVTYLLRVDLYWSIDGGAGGCGAELINHSCEPNVIYRKIKGRPMFVSLRKIRAREEITFDYRYPRECTLVPCCCGSKKCRGTINVK
jgi:SET domain-containing protein